MKDKIEAVKGSKNSTNPWFTGKYDNYDFEAIKNELDFPIDNGYVVGKEILEF
ncbi:hypothetical protein [Companilactobacillus baiquanensis]|uniref:Uncharacterized protein n=1 Tax=Companilactobacillus baiquanensis TaxID=2486005 RepID=A0ABW1UU48_9LACO|nr:hypothetical protein [Companilactobacillus baiquanensis]